MILYCDTGGGNSEKPWDRLPLSASEDRLPSDRRERHINKKRRASSLIKLYVEESGSAEVRESVAAADAVAVSMIACTESMAALARLRRQRVPAR